jgi:hypothetical protein
VRLAARGARDPDTGVEPVPDPVTRARARRIAGGIQVRSLVLALGMAAAVALVS